MGTITAQPAEMNNSYRENRSGRCTSNSRDGAAAGFGSRWLGHLVGGLGHDWLELDRGEASELGLAASAVVGPLDPAHDRDPQLLTCVPAAPVEDVVLQQAEKALHGGVIAS